MTAAALSTRFAAHHPESIRAVYRLYGRLVYSVSYQLLGDAGLAETATQQTFMHAWTTANTLTQDSALGPWLHTIADRVASDLSRGQQHPSQEPIASAHAAYVDDGTSADLLADGWKLRQALDRLPENDRRLMKMHHHDQLSYAEIAGRWDLPVAAVKSSSHRAHRRLVQLLGQCRADPADRQAADHSPQRQRGVRR